MSLIMRVLCEMIVYGSQAVMGIGIGMMSSVLQSSIVALLSNDSQAIITFIVTLPKQDKYAPGYEFVLGKV